MSPPPRYTESIWKRFWHALGGWETLRTDAYLHTAGGLTVLSLPLWLQPLWWDTTINVLAILIGFSVSGFSVALSMADRLDGRILRRSSFDGSSPLLKLIAGYVHYLVVGFGALGFSLLCKAWYFPGWWKKIEEKPDADFFVVIIAVSAAFLWFVGGFLFCYSLTSAVRCVMSIFRLAYSVQSVHDAATSKSQPPLPTNQEG